MTFYEILHNRFIKRIVSSIRNNLWAGIHPNVWTWASVTMHVGYELKRNHHCRITARSSSPKKTQTFLVCVAFTACTEEFTSNHNLLFDSITQFKTNFESLDTNSKKKREESISSNSRLEQIEQTHIKQIVKTSLAKHYSGTCWQKGDVSNITNQVDWLTTGTQLTFFELLPFLLPAFSQSSQETSARSNW